MELVAGCYEQVLFGFAARPAESWTVVPVFTHHAHSASLSAVAVNNRYVVTGSRDETIQIYDMKKKIEHGALLQHNGTITCLEFYGTAHLLSGAEDGLICIWNTKRWECLKSIKAHKGHVTSLSIHPSGKLALSVGTDKTLRTWNLVEGRSAFIKNLKQNAHIIKWSPDGERYVTVITNKVDIYKLDTASITGTITTEKRISSLRFITDSILAIAGDDEIIRFYSCDSQKCLCEFKAHENRIKDIYSFEREGRHVIVTASSDGYIKMWNLDLNKIKDVPSLLCEVNTKARLTCLAVWLDQASEMKENSDKAATLSQANENEKSSIVRKNKVCRTDKSDRAAKKKREITPEKQKSEAPLQKKKKKQNSSS
ncbi:p21-activated protein kinase-interacting protein 1 isoform X1 [Accipiter gentilis]|uniref:p21-activated protein kinase-interacting protein 1 isoform X1 n=2 Tax=Astur gentilis TaxID=8957 RepID=UPI00210F43A4|nr:p21-activated protein kinase-interacting protein 1 isoform X1 [Accipiter gentilis]XP_049679979.1 p21-activated protein kinase-interacting protein 1 isoform X1 [Accipiter gentilis]